MPDLIQDVTWPGVLAVESCQGTVSHGITPAVFVLTTYPQAAAPVEAGDLKISDGQRGVILRGCRVDRITATAAAGGGQVWQLDILDRRWRWRSPLASYGAVSGWYNRVEHSRGKLVPWTIRSPVELARLCLDALGEVGYVIDLPTGLSRADGADLNRYLRLGENFAQSLANPEQCWDQLPPAEALSRLCDYFGRRVVYQPVADRIVIAPVGVGAVLLDSAPYETRSPALTSNPPPSAVVVAGAPVRIQARFRLEAVGREWDDSYVPIDQLSYAPRIPGKPQKTEIKFIGTASPPALGVRIDWTGDDGVARAASVFVGATGAIASTWAALSDAMGGQSFNAVVSWSFAGNVFALQGLRDGQAFDVTLSATSGGTEEAVTAYRADQIQAPQKAGAGWDYCPPPSFTAVRATDRLSYSEALTLARDSVFRCYRIRFIDPATSRAPLALPWYGKLKRRQQVVLQNTRVEQVAPQPRIQGGQNAGNPAPLGADGMGILPEFYNGYSRDREAIVTGSTCSTVGSVTWNPDPKNTRFPNTKETDRVYVPFEVNELEQLVKFTDFVYRLEVLGWRYFLTRAADLILETGCLVRDAETDQLVRWREAAVLGGPGLEEVMIRDDLAVGIIGTYTPKHAIQGYTQLDAKDTKARAGYYLSGMSAKYVVTGAESRQLVGIFPVDLDGAIQQVTWSVGRQGPTTVISRNSEHSPVIPPFPARRKQENLAPDRAAANANQTERNAIAQFLPFPTH